MIKTGKPLLEILSGKETAKVPIWLMRQAGRYLPEYRALRAQAENFLDLCLTPKWAAEITLQPIRRFDFDAAILFADILLIPYALGQKLEFREGEGPVLEPVDEKNLTQLKFRIENLAPVFETLDLVRESLSSQTALIGFCGGPFTVAAYMIDGSSKTNFKNAMKWARELPNQLNQLIEILVEASTVYLGQQIEAGAEVIQIFESWAGLLEGRLFAKWVIEPTRELTARLKKKYPDVPIIGFPRNAGQDYENYAALAGIDALSIDHLVPLERARELQKTKILQGNLDPRLLVKGGAEMHQAAETILKTLGPRFIFNLGHGVLPETPTGHVSELLKIVRNFKAAR